MGQLAWMVGLLTFVCTALLGQAELIGEPWRHYITVGAIVGTAISGYMLQHPWNGQERRAADPADVGSSKRPDPYDQIPPLSFW